ncbi:sll0787 family AIR synthase-like protein [Pseudomonas sp. 10B1]|uniref:sll0787 family AIR synthase-like protein n=1 Tax=unclassified Pseudomonas TaxID=196821 RepID=UPI002B22B224|nr:MULTISPECIES: sll0787 family AIR synthase-like protein [unclassified Pseudomonas]MEA9977946.1 sll0787 family AIR synthase-like protein [Pseudomonas sp. RTS4]MEA9993086.1 sll0787 family AIR synthase-like protein [Pseudomonas sp. AA4]MEB0086028.1 sll0787 family AIR synthase-like protein [Pseudomonas sp. RTI1]MEB0125536.1 sll0787 family AIR synthase-like protein [Pseudomonas sp. CCC1.2]MEB0151671.1 sll0787 family AIR synthase-like protein [Pseudomonas sp. CCC4.3]
MTDILNLAALLDTLRSTPAMLSKQAIQQPAEVMRDVHRSLTREQLYALPGDDTAAIACGDHFQLLAIEGMLPGFVQAAPWFAGWSAVMANVSDITAMGGRATAVVNAYWHHEHEAAKQVLTGIRAACEAYGLLLAGGHTSLACGNPTALAVAITGVAHKLLSTLHVAPGQVLAMAVDLEGAWHADSTYWKAFEGVPAERLRSKLEVLPRLAEAELLYAAKDISNAGVLGSLLMLLETTGCGATIDLNALPCPLGADLARWLQVFPSYGFLMTLEEGNWINVQAAFAFEGLRCERIGQVNASGSLEVQAGEQRRTFWNLREQAFTGFSYPDHDLSPLKLTQQEH